MAEEEDMMAAAQLTATRELIVEGPPGVLQPSRDKIRQRAVEVFETFQKTLEGLTPTQRNMVRLAGEHGGLAEVMERFGQGYTLEGVVFGEGRGEASQAILTNFEKDNPGKVIEGFSAQPLLLPGTTEGPVGLACFVKVK